MGTFQILMFAVTLFFAYQIYLHVQTLEDETPTVLHSFEDEDTPLSTAEALVEQADEAYGQGEFSAAREALQEAMRLDENNTEILNKLAFVTAKEGDVSEALELYERSLALNEDDDLTHNAIASLYRAQGDFGLAQEHYEKALRIDATYPQTCYNYGNLLSDMGHTRKAEEMYRRAIDLQHDFPEAHEALIALQGKE